MDAKTLAGELHISGTDPVMNSRFKLGEVAAAAHAGVGVAVNDIWELKTGRRQRFKFPSDQPPHL